MQQMHSLAYPVTTAVFRKNIEKEIYTVSTLIVHFIWVNIFVKFVRHHPLWKTYEPKSS